MEVDDGFLRLPHGFKVDEVFALFFVIDPDLNPFSVAHLRPNLYIYYVLLTYNEIFDQKIIVDDSAS